MSDTASPRLAIFFFPVVMLAALALGGCSSKPASPATIGGIYISKSGGGSFEQSVEIDGQPGQYVATYALSGIARAVTDPNTLIVAAGAQGIVVSNNDGDTWNVMKTPLTKTLSATMLASKILVAAGTDGNGQGYVIRSLDNGQSWDSVFTIPLPQKTGGISILGTTGDQSPAVVITLTRDPFNGERVYAGTNVGTIFVGEQSGKTWRTLTSIQPRAFTAIPNPTDAGIDKLIASPFNKNEFLVVTHDHRLVHIKDTTQNEIAIAVDTTNNNLIGYAASRKIYDVSYVTGVANALIVGTDQGALTTKDQGKTWADLKVPVDSSQKFSNTIVAVSPTNPNRILVVVDTVIYRSEDGGKSWNTFTLGLPGYITTQISINPKNASRVIVITAASKS